MQIAVLARLRNDEFGTLEALSGRIAKLIEELNGRTMRRYGARSWRSSRADGSYPRVLIRNPRVDVLVLDDWGMSTLRDAERRDMLEILDDRSGARATVMTSQIPPSKWHDVVGDPTTADAICDRLLHNAHRIDLKGPSRRNGKKDTDND